MTEDFDQWLRWAFDHPAAHGVEKPWYFAPGAQQWDADLSTDALVQTAAVRGRLMEDIADSLGLSKVRVVLHPEVSIAVTVNVARSQEEAEKQSRGEAVGAEAEEAAPADLAEFLDPGAAPQPDV